MTRAFEFGFLGILLVMIFSLGLRAAAQWPQAASALIR